MMKKTFKMAAEFYDSNEQWNGNAEDDGCASGTAERRAQCMTAAERLRLHRAHEATVRRKGVEALREMDAKAEEFRRKQMQDKRRSLKEAKTKEEEQRAGVEERRRKLLEEEHERRLLKLQKLWEINRRTDESRRRKRKKTSSRLSLGSGAMSDGTLSSGGRTPTRHYRPHSIAGQLPNYALPTVASQIRAARWGAEAGLKRQLVTVCYRCHTQTTYPEFEYSAPRKRSRSAEPSPRPRQHTYRVVIPDHPLSRDDSSFLSRPLSCRSASSATGPSSSRRLSSIPTFQRSPSRRSKGNRVGDKNAEEEPEGKQQQQQQQQEREQERGGKRRSLLPHRKCPPGRKSPREHSAEFRMFSFRRHDGTASVAVAMGTKTATKSKVETFQRSAKVLPETGSGEKPLPGDVQPQRSAKEERRSRISKPSDNADSVVAKGTSRVAMETSQTTPKRLSFIKHLMTSDGCEASSKGLATKATGARQRPSNIPVAKVERPKDLPSKPRDVTDDVTTADDVRQERDAFATDGAEDEREQEREQEQEQYGDGGWTEDGANSETVSTGTSLDLFLDDSTTSLSEVTAEDLDPVLHRKSGSGRRDVLVHFFPLASHYLSKHRGGDRQVEGGGDDGEGEGEEEETMEIYEELEVLEEVEVSRGGGGGRELIVTLEKIVTEETVEIFCPDRRDLFGRRGGGGGGGDQDPGLRASVSSI